MNRNRKIKILYLIPAEGFGGAERQALHHIRHLPQYGVEVIAVSGSGKRVYDKLKTDGIEILLCKDFPQEFGKPFFLIPYVRYIFHTFAAYMRALKYLRTIIKHNEIDLIFASRVAGWLLAGPIALRYRLPCIWRFGSRVQGKALRVLLFLAGYIFRPAMAVANCKSVYETVKDVVNVPLTVIPNGIDTGYYAEGRRTLHLHEKLGLDQDALLIGLAARPSPDKGMDFLADVVKKVTEENESVHFCIAGEFGWRRHIEDVFNKKGLQGKVSFLGHVDDIVSFYTECAVMILTSKEKSIEGFSNSLLEAMSVGKPVVATGCGGTAEFVINRKTGIIADVNDSSGFASAVLELLDSESLRKELGRNAREHVIDMYSLNQTIRPLSECIKETVDKYQAGRVFGTEKINCRNSGLTEEIEFNCR